MRRFEGIGLIIIELAALVAVVAAVLVHTMAGAVTGPEEKAYHAAENTGDTAAADGTASDTGADANANADANDEQPADPTAVPRFSQAVTDKLKAMTTEEKVAQLFVITPEQLTHVGTVVTTGETTKESIGEYPVGTLIYHKDNIQGKAQAAKMFSGLQDAYNERIGIACAVAYQAGEGETVDDAANAELGVNATVVMGGSPEVLTITATGTGLNMAMVADGATAVNALKNGAIVLDATGAAFEDTYGAVVAAVGGDLPEDVLNSAVGTVLSAKGM